MQKTVLDSFLKTYFNTEDSIIIFGSNSQSKTLDINSDIDIFVFSSKKKSYQNEVIKFKRYFFDVTIINKNDAFDFIEYYKYTATYIDILNSGTIIRDNNKYISKLKSRIDLKPNSNYIYHRMLLLEHKISNNYFLFLKSESIIDCDLVFSNLLEDLLRLRLIKVKIINVVKPNYLLKKINDIDKNLYVQVFKIKENFYLKKDKKITKRQIEELFAQLNFSPKKTYSNKFCYTRVYKNEVVFYSEYKNSDFQNLKNLLKNKKTSFFSFRIDSGNTYREGFYIVAFERKETINNELIPYFNSILSSDLHYPVQLDVSKKTGIYKSKEFETVSKLLLSLEDFNRDNYIEILAFIIGLYIKFGFNKEKLKEKMEFLFFSFANKSLEPKSILDEMSYSLFRLKVKYDNFISKDELDVIIRSFIKLKDNWCLESLPIHSINERLDTIEIPKEAIFNSKEKEYSIINMIFDIFEVKDFHKAYLIYFISKTINSI